jgi:hypothetical protein
VSCISDVAPRGGFAGAYLTGVPLHGSPGAPPCSLKPNQDPSHPVWTGRRDSVGGCGHGCATSVPVVISSKDPKNERVQLVSL